MTQGKLRMNNNEGQMEIVITHKDLDKLIDFQESLISSINRMLDYVGSNLMFESLGYKTIILHRKINKISIDGFIEYERECYNCEQKPLDGTDCPDDDCADNFCHPRWIQRKDKK